MGFFCFVIYRCGAAVVKTSLFFSNERIFYCLTMSLFIHSLTESWLLPILAIMKKAALPKVNYQNRKYWKAYIHHHMKNVILLTCLCELLPVQCVANRDTLFLIMRYKFWKTMAGLLSEMFSSLQDQNHTPISCGALSEPSSTHSGRNRIGTDPSVWVTNAAGLLASTSFRLQNRKESLRCLSKGNF